MLKMSKLESCQKWVNEFNAIPQQLILKAFPSFEEDGLEILATERTCDNCGGTDFTEKENENGEIEYICDNCGENEGFDVYDLPMWGTMWTFASSLDEDWARENIEVMRKCGFWVYDSDETGILFGINGAGYDFYEQHWLPLYDARGLKWHEICM